MRSIRLAVSAFAFVHQVLGTPMLQPRRCYVATPAFTYSATGARERGDSAWAVVQLMPNGVALRPLLPAGRDPRSTWSVRGDTLFLTLFDGLVGWRSVLHRRSDGWRGVATYLTDAITIGRAPIQHAVTLSTRDCAGTR